MEAGELYRPSSYARNLSCHTQRIALGQHLRVHLVALLHQLGQQALLAAQLQLHHGLACQDLQTVELLVPQRAGHGVQHRQRSQCKALRRNKGHAGVKTNTGFAHHQRIARKCGVLAGVRHHHGIAVAIQRMDAKGNGTVGLRERHAHSCLEPLALAVYKVDHGHGAAADTRGQCGQLVKRVFRGRIQDGVGLQCVEPRGLLGCVRRRHGGYAGARPRGTHPTSRRLAAWGGL
ncbi:hypothetical protein D3C71_1015620 [compost metagenome]